ncbi:ParA family protein [Candidatus Methylopumilus turicensis]|uniref:Chromosome partitioning ATPase n=1 Tax=Candidatus Methylopumilus turicensis TaxID=1581680 RepID=A0A0B7J0B7_9PROT|nr:ParA family protein [Candidatus Methylopumilus turicensis]CEN56192.1 Chromosome partitioning ATPase [Candidatus Methylopumilus turicensis]
MQTIAVLNQKGGVGKTTTALNLSASITRKNLSATLIDLDSQGHLTKVFESYPEDVSKTIFGFYSDKTPLQKLLIDWQNIGKFIPSHQELIKVETKYGNGPEILFKLGNGLKTFNAHAPQDFIVLDCPANTGVLCLSAIFAADLVIIPIASDHFSLAGAKRIEFVLGALERVLKRRVSRCYLTTRFDKRRKISSETYQEAQQKFGDELLDTIIYENVALTNSVKNHQDIFTFDSKSTGAKNYGELLEELIQNKWLEVTEKLSL